MPKQRVKRVGRARAKRSGGLAAAAKRPGGLSIRIAANRAGRALARRKPPLPRPGRPRGHLLGQRLPPARTERERAAVRGAALAGRLIGAAG